MIMNKAAYENMPDLQAILLHLYVEMARLFGRAMDAADVNGLCIAKESGEVVEISLADKQNGKLLCSLLSQAGFLK